MVKMKRTAFNLPFVLLLCCSSGFNTEATQCQVDLAGGNNNLCPSDWLPFQDKCYLLVNNKFTFKEAEDNCRSLFHFGRVSTLVSITNPNEEQFVLKNTNMFGGTYKYFWIGYNDIEEMGEFVWTDGTEKGYENWRDGVSFDVREDNCVQMWTDDKWNTYICDDKSASVCKMSQRNSYLHL